MKSRLHIEKSILGAMIYYNGYSQVAHILTANNFSSKEGFFKHVELFTAIGNLYPNRPIDFITVSQELKRLYPDNIDVLQTLYDCKVESCSIPSIVQWSFILLELDISEKFKNEMIKRRSVRENNLEYSEAGAIKEILESINPEESIFEIIEGAGRYFKHLNMEVEMSIAIKFYEKISLKVKNLKHMNSINTALNYLFQISAASPQVKYECQTFADAIADMICTGKSKEKYTEAANLITT